MKDTLTERACKHYLFPHRFLSIAPTPPRRDTFHWRMSRVLGDVVPSSLREMTSGFLVIDALRNAHLSYPLALEFLYRRGVVVSRRS